jgi:hypothetical protein
MVARESGAADRTRRLCDSSTSRARSGVDCKHHARNTVVRYE